MRAPGTGTKARMAGKKYGFFRTRSCFMWLVGPRGMRPRAGLQMIVTGRWSLSLVPQGSTLKPSSHHCTHRKVTIFIYTQEGTWRDCLAPKVTYVLACLSPIPWGASHRGDIIVFRLPAGGECGE